MNRTRGSPISILLDTILTTVFGAGGAIETKQNIEWLFIFSRYAPRLDTNGLIFRGANQTS